MTDQEWYDYGQAHCGIEKRDSVKPLRKAETGEMGWNAYWASNMNSSISKTLTVLEDRGSAGFRLSNGYLYPWFVLELVQKAKPGPPLPQNIENVIYNEDFGVAVDIRVDIKDSIRKLVTEIFKTLSDRHIL